MSRHHAQDLLKMPPPAMTLDEAVARVERLREHIRHDTEMLDPDSADADALSVLLAALRAPTAPPADLVAQAEARLAFLDERIRVHGPANLAFEDAKLIRELLAALRAPTAPERCEATSHDGHRCESRHGHEGPHWWGALTWWTPLAAEAGQQGPPLKSPYGHVWGKPYDDGYATCRCGAREDTRSRERCPAAAPTGETMSAPPAPPPPAMMELLQQAQHYATEAIKHVACLDGALAEDAQAQMGAALTRIDDALAALRAPTCGAGSAIRKDG